MVHAQVQLLPLLVLRAQRSSVQLHLATCREETSFIRAHENESMHEAREELRKLVAFGASIGFSWQTGALHDPSNKREEARIFGEVLIRVHWVCL